MVDTDDIDVSIFQGSVDDAIVSVKKDSQTLESGVGKMMSDFRKVLEDFGRVVNFFDELPGGDRFIGGYVSMDLLKMTGCLAGPLYFAHDLIIFPNSS